MDPVVALALILVLVGAATVLGLLWRARQGTVRVTGSSAAVLTPADVASAAPFGETATLLQFSTEFCARCPATRRLLSQVAALRAGVTHLEVDLTHRADLARRFDILQTPTTLILDGAGRVRARVGGAPSRAGITDQLDQIHRPSGSSHVQFQ